MKPINVTVTAIAAAAAVGAVALVPLPQRVWCAAELRPRGEETVYVEVPGRLEAVEVAADAAVARGQVLARLANVDLDLAIADLEGRETQAMARLETLERERFADPAGAGLEIGTVRESLAGVREQLARKRRDRERLVLRAPRDGVVLPAPAVPPQPDAAGRLPTWSGHVLDPRNVGATLVPGTMLCMVGDRERFEAVMVIDQSEVEFVRRGQRVDLKLDAFPWLTLSGTLAEIAETHIETGSERMSVKAGGAVPTETDPAGREVPISTSYEALLEIDDPDGVFTPGMRGTARIEVGSRTVGRWLLRLLWQTFNFRM